MAHTKITIGGGRRRSRVVERLHRIAREASLSNPLGRALYVANRQLNGDHRGGGRTSVTTEIRLQGGVAAHYVAAHPEHRRLLYFCVVSKTADGASLWQYGERGVEDPVWHRLPLRERGILGYVHSDVPDEEMIQFLAKVRPSTAARWLAHWRSGGSLKAISRSQEKWLEFRRAYHKWNKVPADGGKYDAKKNPRPRLP